MAQQIISTFILIAGFVIGLGAVTVIDIHGFLGRKSAYWTKATIQTHKVTKPLIWFGIILVSFGTALFYYPNYSVPYALINITLIGMLIVNGIFLSFSVSPMLLQKERDGKAEEILSKGWQNKIFVSFIISIVGWWGNLLLFIIQL